MGPLRCRENRILMRTHDLAQDAAFEQYLFEQRIVIKDTDLARMFLQRSFQVCYELAQSRFRKRIEQVNQQRNSGQREAGRIRAKTFDRQAPLRFTFVALKVLLRDLMK